MWGVVEKIMIILGPIITSISAIITIRMQIKNDRKVQNSPELVLIGFTEYEKGKDSINDIEKIKDLFAFSFDINKVKDISDLSKSSKKSYILNFKNIGNGNAKNIIFYHIDIRKNEIEKCLGINGLYVKKDEELKLKIERMPYGSYYFLIKYEDIFKNRYFNILKLILQKEDYLTNAFNAILFSEEEYRNLEVHNFSWEGDIERREILIRDAMSCQKTILKALKYVKLQEKEIFFNKVIKI